MGSSNSSELPSNEKLRRRFFLKLSSQCHTTDAKDFSERLESVIREVPGSATSCLALKDIPVALEKLGMTVSKDHLQNILRRVEQQTGESFSLGGYLFWRLRMSPSDLLAMLELLNASTDLKSKDDGGAQQDSSKKLERLRSEEELTASTEVCSESLSEREESMGLNLDLRHSRSMKLGISDACNPPTERSLPEAPTSCLFQQNNDQEHQESNHPKLQLLVPSELQSTDHHTGLPGAQIQQKGLSQMPTVSRMLHLSRTSDGSQASLPSGDPLKQNMDDASLYTPYIESSKTTARDSMMYTLSARDNYTNYMQPQTHAKNGDFELKVNLNSLKSKFAKRKEPARVHVTETRTPSYKYATQRTTFRDRWKDDHSANGINETFDTSQEKPKYPLDLALYESVATSDGRNVRTISTEKMVTGRPRSSTFDSMLETKDNWTQTQTLTQTQHSRNAQRSISISQNSFQLIQGKTGSFHLSRSSKFSSPGIDRRRGSTVMEEKDSRDASSFSGNGVTPETLDPYEKKCQQAIAEFGSVDRYLRKVRQARSLILRATGTLLLIILCWVTSLVDRPQHDLYLFFRTASNGVASSNGFSTSRWDSLTSREELWVFLKGSLLYQTDLWNDDGNAFNLLGKVRLRQIRSKPANCSDSWFLNEFPDQQCSSTLGFQSRNQEKEAFSNATITNHLVPHQGDSNPFQWTAAREMAGEFESQSYFGKTGFHMYNGNGYIAYLPRNSTDSAATMEELEASAWMDEQTRALWIDFTLFNPNKGYVAAAKLLAEMPVSGGVVTSTTVLVEKIRLGFNVVQVFEILLLVSVFFRTICEVRKMIALGEGYFCLWKYVCPMQSHQKSCQMVLKCQCCKVFLDSPSQSPNLTMRTEDRDKLFDLNKKNMKMETATFKQREKLALFRLFHSQKEYIYEEVRFLKPVNLHADTWRCLGCKAETAKNWESHKRACHVLNCNGLMVRKWLKDRNNLYPVRKFADSVWNYLEILILVSFWLLVSFRFIFYILKNIRMDFLENQILSSDSELYYIDFYDCFFFRRLAEKLIAFILVLLLVQLVQLTFRLFQPTKLLGISWIFVSNLVVIAIGIFVPLFFFGLGFHVAYGSQNETFSSLWTSIASLAYVLLGNSEIASLFYTRPNMRSSQTDYPALPILFVGVIYTWSCILIFSVAMKASDAIAAFSKHGMFQQAGLLRALCLFHTSVKALDGTALESSNQRLADVISSQHSPSISAHRLPNLRSTFSSQTRSSKQPCHQTASSDIDSDQGLGSVEIATENLLGAMTLQDLRLLHKEVFYFLQEKIDNYAFRDELKESNV